MMEIWRPKGEEFALDEGLEGKIESSLSHIREIIRLASSPLQCISWKRLRTAKPLDF